MGTQKEIAKLIINKKANQILALKGNQRKRHAEVKEWFENAKNNNFAGIESSHQEEIEVGHHRIEKREVYSVLVTELPPLHNQNKWLELKTVIMVVSERILWNKTTYDVRFQSSSIESNGELFLKSLRGHWAIENSLHWSLDVTFSEDKSRIRKDNAPENLA